MPIPVLLTDLSQTAASNYPAGSDSPATLDDTQRAHGAFIAQLRDGKGFSNPVVLASTTITDIGGQNSQFVEISGTTTITSFGSTYNGPRYLRFQGALTLTHNATSLNLPGGASITTTAGYTCLAVPNLALTGWNVYSMGASSGGGSSSGGGATGAGTDQVFYENDKLATGSYTIGNAAINIACTFTNGSAVVTAANTFVADQPVRFNTAGTLPTNFSTSAFYYVISTGLSSSAFQVSSTIGGAAIVAGSAGTGTHTVGKVKDVMVNRVLAVATGQTITFPTGVVTQVVGGGTPGGTDLYVSTVTNQTVGGNKTYTGTATFNGAATAVSMDATTLTQGAVAVPRMVLGTAQNTTSGTAIDFTGIPSWVKRITVMFNNVSTNGSTNKLLQIGTSGGIQSTSYDSTCAIIGPTTAGTSSTAGYIIWNSASSESLYGHAIITHMGSNLWAYSSTCRINTSYVQMAGGSVNLSGTLDRVRITTSNGLDTFDAGSVNLLLEG